MASCDGAGHFGQPGLDRHVDAFVFSLDRELPDGQLELDRVEALQQLVAVGPR